MGKVLHQKPRHAPASPEKCFGEVLRVIRLRQGFSQESLGFETGYHRTYIGQLERGEKSPSLRTIVNLAIALKVKGSDLLREMEQILNGERRK
jgi:transcriptional regulator with XRE-family HTH domain